MRWCWLALLAVAAQAGEVELLADPHFAGGFRVRAPQPGKIVVAGRLLTPTSPARPAWDLSQWSSRFPFLGVLAGEPTGRDGFRWANDGKTVIVGDGADLTLGVNAEAEYQGRARKADQPWVHLLVEHEFACPMNLTEMTAARFNIEVRVNHCDKFATPDYTPNLHAAQFQWYLTVQNRNKKSPGYGDGYWFGISLFDDRVKAVPLQVHDDPGTKRLIYAPSEDTYTRGNTRELGTWARYSGDLLPELKAGLEEAWKRGYCAASHDWADYRLGGMNLGWEVPGPFNCEAAVRGMSLKVVAP